MSNTQLPPQTVKRIEEDAEDKYVLHMLPLTDQDAFDNMIAEEHRKAYISGATSEALRSKELVSALKEIRAGSVTGALTRIDINKIADEAIKNYNS